MAWIKTIDEDHATDSLKVCYKKYGDPFEGVDNIWKAHSLNPEALRFHHELYQQLATGKSGLSRMQREMVGVAVSAANRCEYGVRHHGKVLHQLTKNPFLVKAMEGEYASADIPQKDVAMLEYARKLTLHPSEVQKADVEGLRSAGFKDAEILDVALFVAYCNFENRLASGLGVEIEGSLRGG
jgi:uncharacterized peroxidase-related enzyme